MVVPIFQGAGPASASVSVATIVWDNSDADGDWSNGNNWDTGVAPASGNRVVLGTGATSITTGLTQTSVNLESLNLGEGFSGNLNRLLINVGELRINKRHGTVDVSGQIGRVYVEHGPSGSAGTQLTGTINEVYVFRSSGAVVISDSTTIEKVLITATPGSYPRVEIGSSVAQKDGTDIDVVMYGGGSLICESDVDLLDISGTADVTFIGAAACDRLRMWGNSLLRWKSSRPLGGSGPSNRAQMHSGTITFDGNTNTSVTLDSFDQWGGIIDIRNDLGDVVVDSLLVYGGKILMDEGRTVQI